MGAKQRQHVDVGQLAEVGVPFSHATEPARGDQGHHLAGFLFYVTDRRGGRDRHREHRAGGAARPDRAQPFTEPSNDQFVTNVSSECLDRRADCIEELRLRVGNQTSCMVLDLAEVDLIDLDSVRFLRDCQDQKIEIRNCAPYILEWIRRERVEGQMR